MKFRTASLIDGTLRDGTGDRRDVENPATGTPVAAVRDASAQDIDEAVVAAGRAAESWASVPPPDRAALLRRIAERVDAASATLAATLVAEVGKPIREAEAEAAGTAGYFRYAASLLETLTDDIRYTGNRGELVLTRRRPHGVVAAIIPWNYPAALVARKIAPALAAGNAVVLKPDEKTPLSALLLAEIFAEEVPAGLVNIVCGGGDVGSALVRDERTSYVTMTGSTFAGQQILADAAPLVKPVSLELGGKAPFIVLGDADLEKAVADCVASRHSNCGQVCISAERVYVHDSVYSDFVDLYVNAVKELRVGDPTSRDTDIGPKISAAELTKSRALVRAAVADSAQVALGDRDLVGAEFDRGHWMAPTVLTNVTDRMAVMIDEAFGPVTPVARFGDWADVVRRANDSRYGLSAYVYTRDLDLAMASMDQLSFGEVYINRTGPEEVNGFHTGYRMSGLGGDDGPYGLDEYFLKQTVYLNSSAMSR